jgi:hypothetical protein
VSFNENINRWIFASIAKHFDDRRKDIILYIEGQERNTSNLQQYFELRIDGPYIVELSKNYYRVDLEVNVLCTAKTDPKDNYLIQRLTGIICSAFTRTINVYKFGIGLEDDQSLVICLQMRTDHKELLQVSNFGQVEPDARLHQSTVEGHYRGHFDGTD